MHKLTIRLHGEKISEITLESGREYVAGRGSDAQIPLPAERGISRHHLKFYESDGKWYCEALSRFLVIRKGEATLDVFEMQPGCAFTLAPYEFTFEHSTAPAIPPEPLPDAKGEAPTLYDLDDDANTLGGRALTMVPFLRIRYPHSDGEDDQQLDGNSWTIGRDSECDVQLKTNHASRSQFEIERSHQGFFITDLDSANGTALNGKRLPPHTPVLIESGDKILVKDVKIVFEMRDMGFGNMTPAKKKSRGGISKRGILSCGLALFAIYYFYSSKSPAPADQPNQSSAFERLSPDQRATVKDSFTLARTMYVKGKFANCLTELAKVTVLVPQYENSKELQTFCEQGQDLAKKQQDMEYREAERQKQENQIAALAGKCRARLKGQGTVDEVRTCLAEAIEIDPAHRLVKEMIKAAEDHEAALKLESHKQAEEEARYEKGVAQYRRAEELYKRGNWYRAVEAYTHFLNTPYPRSEEKKETARRELASVRAQLRTQVGKLTGQCNDLGKKHRLKEAYNACDRALAADPDNAKIKVLRERWLGDLKRELKSIYEDSTIEESMGNLDKAKDMWRMIMKQDIQNGEYAKKAGSKLQMYGIDVVAGTDPGP